MPVDSDRVGIQPCPARLCDCEVPDVEFSNATMTKYSCPECGNEWFERHQAYELTQRGGPDLSKYADR